MFPLRYRDDPCLAFMEHCSHGDLQDLVDLLSTRKGFRGRSSRLDHEPVYFAKSHDLPKVWSLLAAQVQRLGADEIASSFRKGMGVLYSDILGDICRHLEISFEAWEELSAVELRLIATVFRRMVATMSQEECTELINAAKGMFPECGLAAASPSPESIVAVLEASVALGGAAALCFGAIAANAVANYVLGRGLGSAGKAGLMPLLSVYSSPVGPAISGNTILRSTTGPAYEAMVPVAIHIAYLRLKFRAEVR